MEALIEQERTTGSSKSAEQAELWTQKIVECSRLRKAYQDQQAAGLMTLEELGGRLEELETTRRLAQTELKALAEREARVKELEEDRDALLEGMAETVPGILNDLTGEERNKLYRMLRLEVTPSDEGYEVRGAFCTSELTPGAVPSGYATSSGVRFAAAPDKIRVLCESPPEPNDKEVCGRMREWEDEARYVRRS